MNSGVTSGMHQLLTCQGLSLFFLAADARSLVRRQSQCHLSTFVAPIVPVSNALDQQVARYKPRQLYGLPVPLLFLCLWAHVVYLPMPLAALLLQIVIECAVSFAHSHIAVDWSLRLSCLHQLSARYALVEWLLLCFDLWKRLLSVSCVLFLQAELCAFRWISVHLILTLHLNQVVLLVVEKTTRLSCGWVRYH